MEAASLHTFNVVMISVTLYEITISFCFTGKQDGKPVLLRSNYYYNDWKCIGKQNEVHQYIYRAYLAHFAFLTFLPKYNFQLQILILMFCLRNQMRFLFRRYIPVIYTEWKIFRN